MPQVPRVNIFSFLYRHFDVQSIQARTLSVDGVWPDLHAFYDKVRLNLFYTRSQSYSRSSLHPSNGQKYEK